MISSTFPNYESVNAQKMKYSVVVMSGWLVSGAVYYYTRGNHSICGTIRGRNHLKSPSFVNKQSGASKKFWRGKPRISLFSTVTQPFAKETSYLLSSRFIILAKLGHSPSELISTTFKEIDQRCTSYLDQSRSQDAVTNYKHTR